MAENSQTNPTVGEDNPISTVEDTNDKDEQAIPNNALVNKIKSKFTFFALVSTLAVVAGILLLYGLIVRFNIFLNIVLGVCVSLVFILIFMKGVVHFTSLQERSKVLPYSGFNIRAPVTSRQKRRDKAGTF